MLLPFLSGCSPTADPPANPEPSNSENSATAPAFTTIPRGARLAAESWDAIHIKDHHVGYAHTQRLVRGQNDDTRIEWRSEMVLAVKRDQQTITQRVEMSSEEEPSGRVLACQIKLAVGAIPIVVRGRREGTKLRIETSSAGRNSASEITLPDGAGGLFALDQTLIEKPLEPGEERRLLTLFPGHGSIEKAALILQAGQYETTPTLDGPQELLRIEMELQTAGETVKQTIWTDRGGELRKLFHPAMEQTVYRTTRERALAGTGDAPTFDIAEATTVRVKLPVEYPHASKRAVYKVRLKESDPTKALAQGASQQVKSIDDKQAEVTVTAIRPGEPPTVDASGDRKPTDKDSSPNALIESDDPYVVALAMSVVPQETDPWRIAVALEKLVRSKMHSTPESQAFATAAEVARRLQGDCTEFGVLLAALLRARKIPARVAIGLVYYEKGGGFAYHLWTEAWIGDRWVPLDATLARGGIGAAHLKISDSHLAGASATSAFLPVLQVMGQMELEVVEIN